MSQPSASYKIFISYRRDDSQATTDHIYDRLRTPIKTCDRVEACARVNHSSAMTSGR